MAIVCVFLAALVPDGRWVGLAFPRPRPLKMDKKNPAGEEEGGRGSLREQEGRDSESSEQKSPECSQREEGGVQPLGVGGG
jgi:hypothetical protein